MMAGSRSRLRFLVAVRADGRCEYCRRYQDLMGDSFFEVEHIIPVAHGGQTTPDNLALACRRCNLLKGAAVEAHDPRSARSARLFNPRTDRWDVHFRRSRNLLRIYGRTAIGRATVALLRLNTPGEQRARRIQRDHLGSLFPLD